jgi:hypothetical protein
VAKTYQPSVNGLETMATLANWQKRPISGSASYGRYVIIL